MSFESQPPPGQPATPAQVIWGPGRALAGLGALIVLVALEAVLISAFDSELESLAAKLVLQASLAMTLVAVAFVVARPGGGIADPADLGLRRPGRSVVGVSLLAYLVYVGCALVISVLLSPEQVDITRELGSDEGTLGAIAAGTLIIGAAPLSEEIFFRGFLFGGIRQRAPFVVAALVPSTIWGLFHYTGPDTWGVVLQLTLFGLVLAWLYERTGSIWPPIAVHAFNNAVAFALLVG